MDTFPALVIHLSLFAVSRDPRPWAALNDDDNLIFRWEDSDRPFATAAWEHPAALGDAQ
jgi:hypothetical protein